MAQYREQMTVTGDFMRVNIFPTHTYNYGRKKKVKPTGAAQEKLNALMQSVNSDIQFYAFGERPCTHDCSSCGADCASRG